MLVHLVNTENHWRPCCVALNYFTGEFCFLNNTENCLAGSGEELDSNSNLFDLLLFKGAMVSLDSEIIINVGKYMITNVFLKHPISFHEPGEDKSIVRQPEILQIITKKKPNHCSSSYPTLSVLTSLSYLPQLSLIWNQRNSFVLQHKNNILSNWARQKHNAQSLAVLCFPKAHEKRKRTIYQTIHHPISISVKHLSCGLGFVTSQNLDMKILATVTWIGKYCLKLLPLCVWNMNLLFRGITGMMHVWCECLRVPPLCVIVGQSYHCNNQKHTWLQLDHMASSNRSRENGKQRERESDWRQNEKGKLVRLRWEGRKKNEDVLIEMKTLELEMER